MRSEDVPNHVRRRLRLEPQGEPEVLSGGSLNRVWRVRADGGSVIVKHAPPFVATAPQIPLDQTRLLFEAGALARLAADQLGSPPAEPVVRAPQLLDLDRDTCTMIIEDVGSGPHLGALLETDPSSIRAAGDVGRFIGNLHRRTRGVSAFTQSFNNAPMQRTRRELQYLGVGEQLASAGVTDARALGRRAGELGARLVQPGVCLTMGDLWPPSILPRGDHTYLIDWELCHYGHPLQDVAHLLAHLWMYEQRGGSPATRDRVRAAGERFIDGYRASVGEAGAVLWPPSERIDAAVHFGCELVMRTLGPFSTGYLYDGLGPTHPLVREAIAHAVHHLREPERAPTFKVL